MGVGQRAGLIGVAIATVLLGLVGVASATSDPSFTCVRVDADTCTVTIPLTSNMNEQVSSTMPDTQPWFMNNDAGQGPYSLFGPGSDQMTWNGVPEATQGTVWSDILTTNANEPSGSEAVITFAHVNSSTTTVPAGEPYSSMSYNYPLKVADGSVATVTGVVTPVPAKGHLILQRRSAKAWVSVGALSYSSAKKKWSIRFTWHFAKHATETFRLVATAAPGLTTTDGGTFKIATLG